MSRPPADPTRMRLLAISDLHLSSPSNFAALAALPAAPDDWLILAGDVAEHPDKVRQAFEMLSARFARLIWVPGNHELWTVSAGGGGEAKYRLLVDLARECGVLTPEDPYPLWPGPGGPCVLVPMFLLYDYSFRPAHVALEDVLDWAREERAVCADEMLLSPAPFASRIAWCHARCALTQARLEALDPSVETILINHYPLRADLVRIPRIPRFTPWCGTTLTEDWHRRYRARAVVSGHLHVRRTDWRDGVRFEEVSLGYPRQWDPQRGIAPYLREILPGPSD
ncbi:metallophosphoesterase [Azorhizobium sp. AG788]|uniref:metallophosphoesterase family protein n=1 Tax=Azorhizobium sp. AG788 TaxID=2183897 RepID=UPI003139CE3C